jgi:predicted amino acid racemase
MAFRFQIFVTRSDVVLVKGIQEGCPGIVGIYDSQGRKKEGF